MTQLNTPSIQLPAHKQPLGVALGSGSARGWAHIGVLRGLKRLGIEPQVICGASMGALVGASYACGTLEQLYEDACQLKAFEMLKMADVTPGGGGFLKGKQVMKHLAPYLSDESIEQLPLVYGAIATNLTTGQEVCMHQGSLREAVRASISIPLLFEPVHDGQQWLLDGGLVNPIPISWCRQMGARTVIAVAVHVDSTQLLEYPLLSEHSETLETTAISWIPQWLGNARLLTPLMPIIKRFMPRLFGQKKPGMVDILGRFMMIMHNEVTRLRLMQEPPDLLLHVKVPAVHFLEFHHAEPIIAAGEACVQEHQQAILSLLGQELP